MENDYVLHFVDDDYLQEVNRMQLQEKNGEILKIKVPNKLASENECIIVIDQLIQQTRFPTSSLNIQLVSDDQAQLEIDQDDIRDVCETFGKVMDVDQRDFHKVIVTFEDPVDCYFAQRILNGHVILELGVQLLVQWASKNDLNDSTNKLDNIPHQVLDLNNHKKEEMFINNNHPIKNNQQQPKYTCRYEIQIENDRDFQVARKIIGSKGCNMKKIIDSCVGDSQQIVKLRLRGKGSGYKEGPLKQESNEQLHLCVSSKSNTLFQKVCTQVESLLSKIFEEYKQYNYELGRPIHPVLFRKISNNNQKQYEQHSKAPLLQDQILYYEFPQLLIPKLDKRLMR